MRVLAAPGPDAASAALAMQEAFGHPAARRLRALGGARATPRTRLDEPEEKMLTTEGRPVRRHRDPHRRRRRARRCPPARSARSIVNGPSRFLGFLGNDELTRESLTGWGGYRTGDLGYLDEDGHFVYVGRSKDIIRRGGVTIVPAEVEPVILRHPAVHEVAIVPLPDDRLGERACAAHHPQARRSRARRSPSCRSSSTPRASPSTRGPSPSRSSTSSRARRR